MYFQDQPLARRHLRPALLDLIEQAELEADSDEAYFLAQLRAAVATVESPAERLRACYRDWPSAPSLLCDKYRD